MTELRASHTVAIKIRTQREQLGWSRRKLADLSRLSENTIENIERGRRPVTVDDLMVIAAALETSAAALLPADSDYSMAAHQAKERHQKIVRMMGMLDSERDKLSEVGKQQIAIINRIRELEGMIDRHRLDLPVE